MEGAKVAECPGGRAGPVASAGAETQLAGGALSALGAGACCLGPLALVSIGASGAWIGNLALLAPYRWLFVAAALGFMGLAWHRLYREKPAAATDAGAACAAAANRRQRIAFWLIAALVLAAVVYPYLLPLFY